MNQPNTLLKVVSILYIIFNVISLVVIVLGALGIGALLGGAAGDVSAGIGMAVFFSILGVAGSILGIAAGVTGLKAQNLKLCNTFAIILIVLALISFVGNLTKDQSIAVSLLGLVLPVLYMIGVRKEINETR